MGSAHSQVMAARWSVSVGYRTSEESQETHLDKFIRFGFEPPVLERRAGLQAPSPAKSEERTRDCLHHTSEACVLAEETNVRVQRLRFPAC